ncbi:meiosis-specific protein MEI4 isoform X2 [Kryptolebias marmoratus]|uniref:meiosis-specific protein MEI4 isoform X2 n=1 Tax=Kryptolebias marmoratus TaxID=37003 RepID=UPI000D530318|nr:meiosis-specific protein MEI4 isoform X2 [Kryptolebias marmoratus]
MIVFNFDLSDVTVSKHGCRGAVSSSPRLPGGRISAEHLKPLARLMEPDGLPTEDNMDDLSQDLFGPGSLMSCDSETPDLLLQDPPRSPGGAALRPHVHFLLSLCALHRVGVEARLFSPDGLSGSVLADTVCHLLRCVAASCGNPPAPGFPPDLVLRACQVAARALELLCSPRWPSVEFMRRVEELLKQLTEVLLHSKQPSGAAERLTQYLIALGSSRISKSFLIRHIISEIGSVADQLWQASQEPLGLEVFPVDRYQNSGHLLGILEELLQDSEVARCRVEEEETGFLRLLERRLFLLSEEFPLFSVYMWRIRNLLGSSDRSDVGQGTQGTGAYTN